MSEGDKQEKSSRKQQEQDQHRQEILDAAVALFADLGYYQTTMQMIADRAGFSVGYLYKHFAGKEEMYRELLGFHMFHMQAYLEELRGQGLAPLEEIHRSLELVCGHFNKYPEFMRIYHQEIGEEIGELLQRKTQHHELLVRLLGAAQKRGELQPCDVNLLASAIQGATKELFYELAGRGGDRPFDPLIDFIFQIFIDPLRT